MGIIYQGEKYLFACTEANAIRDNFKNVETVEDEEQGKKYLTSSSSSYGSE